MSKEERSAAENAIWLCALHAKEVDRDEKRFPVELLMDWKKIAEVGATNRISDQTLAEFRQDLGDVHLLCGPELGALRDEMHRKALDLHVAQALTEGTERRMDPESIQTRMAQVGKARAITDWFSEQRTVLDDLLVPYMRGE